MGEKPRTRGRGGRGSGGLVCEFGGDIIFVGFHFDGKLEVSFIFGGRFGDIRDREGSLFPSWAIVDFHPALLEPKTDFVRTGLFGGRLLEKVDFDLFPAVQVCDDSITEVGEGAGTNITADAIVVFVHKKEDIGTINVLVEGTVDVR